MSAHRVVITGMGVIAANALSTGALARALEERRSGIRETEAFGTEGRARTAGEVDLPGPTLDEEDRVSRLALHAAEQALQDSGLAPGGGWSEDTGVMIGTSRGPALSLERFMRSGDAEARRKLFAEVPFSSIARNIAARFGLGGILSTVTMACVSSSLAIGRALDEIRRGRASLMVAGGADALTQLSFSGFSVLRAMTPTVCRPLTTAAMGWSWEKARESSSSRSWSTRASGARRSTRSCAAGGRPATRTTPPAPTRRDAASSRRWPAPCSSLD